MQQKNTIIDILTTEYCWKYDENWYLSKITVFGYIVVAILEMVLWYCHASFD